MSDLSSASDGPAAEKFLQKIGVPYEVKDEGITVHGDLDLSRKGLTELPDLSNVFVIGKFDCSDNLLTSLKGAPKAALDFDCSYNNLTDLKGGPGWVADNYICHHAGLQSLEGAPGKLNGRFWCQHNSLASLDGGPSEVAGDYFCYDNKLPPDTQPPDVKGMFHNGLDRPPRAAGASNFLKPPRPPEMPVEFPGVTPDADEGGKTAGPAAANGVAASKFSSPEAIKNLQGARQLIKSELKIADLDEEAVKVKSAAAGPQGLRIRLENDHTLLHGRANGAEFIGAPSKDHPFDATDAAATISLAKSKGWTKLNLHGTDGNKAMLFLAAEKQGLSVSNPPPKAVIEQMRESLRLSGQPAAAAPVARRAQAAAPH